jgi:bleomycin hydrolase
MTKDISTADLAKFHKLFAAQPLQQAIARAVQNNGVTAASENYAAKRQLERVFSIEIPTGKVTNQKKSGRCWLFATLNTLRHQFAKKYHFKDFELSQNYNSFFDRLEKANQFYERVLATTDQPLTGRLTADLFAAPDSDGGQWANAAALIAKYGVVPQAAMPETYNSSKTDEISESLMLKLRKDGLLLRQAASAGKTAAELQQLKQDYLAEVYRMLVYAFGEPPLTFDLAYRDDDKKYHAKRQLTPQSFFADYFDWDFNDYVCLTNAPDHELGKVYGLPSQDYIFNGQKIAFVNTDISALKSAAIAQLKAGETVWFGNDVLKDLDRQQGILAPEFFSKSELFGVELQLSKADRLRSHEAGVSHAMTLVGVDLAADQPRKWKVENSWGEKIGDDGYFVMSDQWFDDYVYEVIVKKAYLQPAQTALLDQPRVDLEPWDSLA